jgi:hypothetical protein
MSCTTGHSWLAALPADMRAIATAHNIRIVNRIADLWGHCEYARLYFQSLLIDRREGRGLPPEVRKGWRHCSSTISSVCPACPRFSECRASNPPRIPDAAFPPHAQRRQSSTCRCYAFAEPERVSTEPSRCRARAEGVAAFPEPLEAFYGPGGI